MNIDTSIDLQTDAETSQQQLHIELQTVREVDESPRKTAKPIKMQSLSLEQKRNEQLKTHIQNCKTQFLRHMNDIDTYKPHNNVQELVPFTIAGFNMKDRFLGFRLNFFDYVVLKPLVAMQTDPDIWTEETLKQHLLIKSANNYSYIYGKRQIIETIILLLIFTYVAYDDIAIIVELSTGNYKYKEYMDACMFFDIMTWGMIILLKFMINLKLLDYSLEIVGFICFVCTVFNLFFGLTSADLMGASFNQNFNKSLSVKEGIQTVVETSILCYYWWSTVLFIRETKKLKYMLQGYNH